MEKICNDMNSLNYFNFLKQKELEYYRAVLKSFDISGLNRKLDFNISKDIKDTLKNENKTLIYSTNTIQR